MKGIIKLTWLYCITVVAVAACSKSSDKKDVAAVAQDTMLMHDLAEANKNTAAAEATDTTEAMLLSRASTGGGAGSAVLTNGSKPTTTTTTNRTSTSNAPASTEVSTQSTPRITAPTHAADANPTNVPNRMTSTSGGNQTSASNSGDSCDSPSMSDQRSCLNRSIATNDADLNRVYRDLIAQARLSGGADLEERFRQTQRAWVDRRDVECRQQTNISEGKLWAREMARCLAEYSTRRTSELQSSLNQLRGQ